MGIQNQDGALYMATGIDNSGLYKGKQEAMGIIRSMASEVTSFDIFAGIGTSAAIAFAQAAKSSYDFAKEYQKNMTEVATISSEISNNLSAYQQSLLNLTTEIPVTANDSSKALYGIVSAGYDGANGLKMLEVSAKAAVGGVTDTATAADGMTSIMNAYRISMDKAEEVSDQLFTTVRLGKTTFGEISASISQAAPTAAAFGVELDQLLGALATITKTGTPTAQAMTQIRAAIQATSNYLGDAAFEGRSFQEALQLLYDKAGGSASKLKDMLGTDEALAAVLKITGENAKGAAADLRAVGDSAGASEEAFKKMVDTADNQLKLLGNNITAALAPMGTEILKKVQDAAQAFNEAFANGDIEESIKRIETLVLISASAWGTYKVATLVAAQAELYHQGVVHGWNATMQLQALRLNIVSKAKELLAAKTKALNAVMLKNPYALAVAGVVALGIGLYKLAIRQSDAEKAQKKLNKSFEEFTNESLAEKISLDQLFSALKKTNEGTDDRKKMIKQVNDQYGKYLPSLLTEKSTLEEIKTAYDKVNTALQEQIALKIKNEASTDIVSSATKQQANSLEYIRKELRSKLKNNGVADAAIDELQSVTDEYYNAGQSWEKAFGQAWHNIKTKYIGKTTLGDGFYKEMDSYVKSYYNMQNSLVNINKKFDPFLSKLVPSSESTDSPSGKKDGGENAFNSKYNSTVKSQQAELLSFLKDKGFEITQAEIDIMQDGNDKKLAQMKLDHDKELALLDKQKQDRLDKAISNQKALFDATPANKDKTFNSESVKLSSEEEAVFSSAESAIKKRQLNEEAVFFQGVLDQYKTYTEQRLGIQRKFQQDRDILTKQGASDEKQEELSIKESDALSAIDKEFASRSIDFESWMNEVANMSLDQLLVTLQEAESALAAGNLRSNASGSDGSELAELRAKVKALQEQIRSEKSSGKTGEDGGSSKRSVKEWQSLYKTLNKVNDSFEEIGDSVGGVAGDIIKSAGSIVSATLQGIDGIMTLVSSSSSAMQATSNAAATSISTVEKASVILAIISAALQVAMKIASLFTKDREVSQKTIDQYEAYMDTVDKVIEKNNELMESLSGSAAEVAAKKSQDLINKQIEATRNLGNEFLTSRKKGEHSYGYNIVKNLKPYGEQLKKYGYDPKHAESLFSMSPEQLELMRKEMPEAWAKIDNQTRGYLETIIECGEASEELKDKLSESFTGVSFDSVSDEFLDMLYDMESSTEDFANSFEDHMRKAMIRAMFNDKYKSQLEAWYIKFSEAMSDGEMTDTERAELDSLKNIIIEGAKAGADEINGMFDVSRSQSTSSGGFETMSQDTGKELNGRFTALQITGEEIKKQVMTQTDIQQQTLNHIVKLAVCPEYMSEVRDITLEMSDKMDTAVKHLSELPKQTVLLESMNKKLDRL